MALTHDVYDTGIPFSVNPVTREISNESSSEVVLMQYDHNSECLTFEIPRYNDGHDMSLCDLVQIHYNNIDANTRKQNKGVYIVNDMHISSEDENLVVCTWLISCNVTKYAGNVSFLLRFACTNENGTVEYVWHTDIFKEMYVSTSIYNSEAVVEDYSDVLEAWKEEINADIQSWKAGINADIEAWKKEETTIIDETKVVFSKDYYTAYDVGKIKGSTKRQLLIGKGKTLADYMALFDEERNPKVVPPSVSLTFAQAKAHEVGTNLNPFYRATFDAGSYEYDESTGVTVESWLARDSYGNSLTTRSGTFPMIQVGDDATYVIQVRATHSAGTVPHTNQGNEYAEGQIAAGTKSARSGAVTGYRNSFYGTKTTKDALDSTAIRALSKSNKALANGATFNISIPVGALRVVIAYPATLRDLTSVIDVNGMNTNIVGSFVVSTIDVEGANNYTAIPYKVYVFDSAEATTVTNTYKVTI